MTEEAIARHPEPGLDIFGIMGGADRPGLDFAIETSMEHRVQVSRYPERRRTGIKTAPRKAEVDENPFIVSLLAQPAWPAGRASAWLLVTFRNSGVIVAICKSLFISGLQMSYFLLLRFLLRISKKRPRRTVWPQRG
jgi:hypothetical protein